MRFYEWSDKRWPISSTFDAHKRRPYYVHPGVDYACPRGTEIKAIQDGKVIHSAKDGTGYGQLIKMLHVQGPSNRWVSWYGHMYKRLVKVGDEVKAGQVIALADNEGNSTGNHLHLGLQKNNNWVDYELYNTLGPPPEPNKPIDHWVPPEVLNMHIGIDVSSSGQRGVDWKIAKAAGASFAIPRATIGINGHDRLFPQFAEGARAEGLYLGAYHVVKPDQGVGQVHNIIETLEGYTLDLPIWLDVERGAPGVSKSAYRKLIIEMARMLATSEDIHYSLAYHAWNSAMYQSYYSRYSDWNYGTARLSTYPAIYTSRHLAIQLLQTVPEYDYTGLAVAHYTEDPKKPPLMPPGWDNYIWHQFSADGNGLGSRFGISGNDDVDVVYWNEVFSPFVGNYDEPQPPEPSEFPDKFEARGIVTLGETEYIAHTYYQRRN